MTNLAGKTVVLTRPVEQSSELAELLAEVDVLKLVHDDVSQFLTP
mgnify:CR=1 FL=1